MKKAYCSLFMYSHAVQILWNQKKTTTKIMRQYIQFKLNSLRNAMVEKFHKIGSNERRSTVHYKLGGKRRNLNKLQIDLYFAHK